jgi:hypothetical protein
MSLNTNIDNLLLSVDHDHEQVGTNETNGYSDICQMGVCSSPKFIIPFDCIQFFGLHASIGIRCVFVNKLEEFIGVDMI